MSIPTTPNTPTNQNLNSEQTPKRGLLARASDWADDNPVKATALITTATTGAIELGKKGYVMLKDRLTEKTVEPAKEQASAFVKRAVRGFSNRF